MRSVLRLGVVVALVGAVAGLGATTAEAAPDVVPCPVAVAPPAPGARPVPAVPPPTQPAVLSSVGGERLASPGLVLPADAPPVPAGLTAPSWVVADLDSGAVLAACAPHAHHAPASTQKLLTALAVLPRVDPAQVAAVTAQDLAFEPGSSAVGLVAGGRYPVSTLVLGMLLVSGNDAANVLARLAGGPDGVAGTIAAMNAEAARLGARDTHAANPHGLDAPGQRSSAYDLALIGRAAFARPDFGRYAATARTQIPAQPPRYRTFQIQNDNPLLANYPGALGGKTGFTDAARHTFVGAAARDGRRLVVTMMGAEHRPVRVWRQAAALLDWGFGLPAGAEPVGRLVRPGEDADGSDRDAAAAGATTAGPVPGGHGGGRDTATAIASVTLTGLAAAAVLVGSALLSRRRELRRRGSGTRTAGGVASDRRPRARTG